MNSSSAISDSSRVEYSMYSPDRPERLDRYRPWNSRMVETWQSQNLELTSALPSWHLSMSSTQPKSNDEESCYACFKGVEDWLKTVEKIYRDNRNFFFSQIPFIIHASKILVTIAQPILTVYPEMFFERELDKRLWKSGVLEIVRMLRKPPRNPNEWEKYFRSVILPIYLEQMIKLYTEFFDCASKCILHKFDDGTLFHEENLNSNDGKFLDLLYRLRICIGDMHRYNYPSGSQYSQSFENYEIARLLRKDYGRAYYQQGVLAVMSKNSISAMYYFARAHFAAAPTEGAKDQLLEIHSQSFQTRLANKRQYWYSLSKYLENDVKRNRRYRRQIWIMPYPFPAPVETPKPPKSPPPNKKEHVSSLSTPELFDRFSITFTDALGKLFSRIGMDEFEQVAEESLVYFEGILQREYDEGHGVNFVIMMHIVGLVTFVLQSTILHKKNALHGNGLARNQLKHNIKLATLYMLELYSVVVERLSKLVVLMDWDNPQIQYLSAAVMVWSVWLSNNQKLWTIPHVRPRFSVRRIEKSRNLNRFDQTDDIWVVFGKLLTRIERLMCYGHAYSFPSVADTDESSLDLSYSKLPPMQERYILHGFLPSVLGSAWYTRNFYIRDGDDKLRAFLMIRLQYIHLFGKELITKNLAYLSHSQIQPGVYEYTCNAKLIFPKDLKDSCGLYERNYWFWFINLERMNAKPPRKIRPYGYKSRTIVRSKKVSKLVAPTANGRMSHDLPITDINKLWCNMNDHNYRSDMVVIARRVLLDTNCFINKLAYVEKLIRIFPYPILLPVTVVLELKGLSKGGMKLRDRAQFTDLRCSEALERIKQGNEVSYCAKDALELIEKHLRCFKIVTTRGRIFSVKSIYEKIQDENFDPYLRNDNRILETCVYLEFNDKETRKLDTPLRLYRKTVLVTGDRGLRVKSTVHEVPTKEIESFVIWVERYKKPRPVTTNNRALDRPGGTRTPHPRSNPKQN